MAIKTISLELDAYEKLKQAKRGNESFSAVVRRANFAPPAASGELILQETAKLYGCGKGPDDEVFKYWEETEQAGNAASPSHWKES